ncbi:hypothetical protein DE146DRAFT_254258 [Phaeosphaeria sp. MPI-PUGE-AT-0046c]|nr:hypothetical protein DE146DRAFT_254258 [Phaeosphaeria sp. MPI-PUGE-AT-0046c]
MYRLLFIASVAHATMYDAGQVPLQMPGRDVVEQLTLTQDLRYVFPMNDAHGHARLESLGDIIEHPSSTTSSIIIDVPLDATLPGSVIFSANSSDSLEPAIWTSSASLIHLEHVGIRKGGMISMPTLYPAALSLDSPYISLPKEIFNVLLQAAETSFERNYVVHCALISRFPDLIFGVEAVDDSDENGDFEVQEVVVTPRQYVFETEGQCMLLARRAVSGRSVIGWAAVRGRKVVLDLGRERLGFF